MPNELMKTLTVGANTYDLPQKTSDLTNDSGFITSETDPTVPSWAKASSKPTYTANEVGAAASSHTHGDITNSGDITANATIANGDRLVINDESASKITNSSITFGTSTSQYLANNGTWQSVPTVPTKTSDLTNDSGFITSESDPVFSASAAHGISSSDISTWNAKSDFSGSYNDLTDKPTIPAAVTESTVAGWGFTKNTGTYSKPSGGIPKTDLASAVQTSLGKADSALQSFTESDPTVPSWAKQASKPTYTASEVGALPDSTSIPSKTSDLTNDSGFITSYTETDPVFSASAAAGISSSDITNWDGKADSSDLSSYLPLSGGTLTGQIDFGTASTPISQTVLMQGYVVGGSSATERTYKDLIQLVNADGNRVAVVRAIDDVGYNELDIMVLGENNNPTNNLELRNTNGTKTARIYGDLTILSPAAGDNSTHAASTAWAQNEFKYKSGNVVNIGGGVFAGYFDSSKNLYFHIPLNKDLANITSASISTDTSWAIFCSGSVLLSNTTLASFGTITCTKTDTGVLVKVVPSSTGSLTARETVSVRANGASLTLT